MRSGIAPNPRDHHAQYAGLEPRCAEVLAVAKHLKAMGNNIADLLESFTTRFELGASTGARSWHHARSLRRCIKRPAIEYANAHLITNKEVIVEPIHMLSTLQATNVNACNSIYQHASMMFSALPSYEVDPGRQHGVPVNSRHAALLAIDAHNESWGCQHRSFHQGILQA
jgi:hypothetical protein